MASQIAPDRRARREMMAQSRPDITIAKLQRPKKSMRGDKYKFIGANELDVLTHSNCKRTKHPPHRREAMKNATSNFAN